MPTLTAERVSQAFDDFQAERDSAGQPTATPAATTPAEVETPAETPSPETGTPEITETVPSDVERAATPDAHQTQRREAPLDTLDLKAIKDRYAAEHPDMVPVMEAFLKESERGLNKKFEQLAAMRKDSAEELAYAQVVKDVPKEELLGLVQLYRLSKYGTPQQKLQAADATFQWQEAMRTEAQMGNAAPQPPPIDPITNYQQAQQQQGRINAAWDALKSDFGGNEIPMNQREHVVEELQKLGIQEVQAAITAIPLVWKGLYGTDYQTVAAITKQRQQEKQNLGISGGIAPGSASPIAPAKPKGVRAALSAVLDEQGLR